MPDFFLLQLGVLLPDTCDGLHENQYETTLCVTMNIYHATLNLSHFEEMFYVTYEYLSLCIF